MPKINKTLSKTTEKKLQALRNKYSFLDNIEEVYNNVYNLLLQEKYLLKECSETAIVDCYIKTFKTAVKPSVIFNDTFYNSLKQISRKKLADKYTSNNTYDNNIDRYFNDVKRQYIEHPVSEQDELEFNEENRDIFIKNNLKLVIECAKRYQGLGLPLDDLIQAGNTGLLKAFDKYDKNRANLRISILKDINNHDKEEFTKEEVSKIIIKAFKYPKKLDETLSLIPEDGFKSKEEFIQWTNDNIKTAVFASVAFLWIRSDIIDELNKHSKLIRMPKNEKEAGKQVNMVYLDSINPHTDDNYHDNEVAEATNEEFAALDEEVEKSEKNELMRNVIQIGMDKLTGLQRRIIMKRYGINMPYTLTIGEIAENECLNQNKVKQIIAESLGIIAANISDSDKSLIKSILN